MARKFNEQKSPKCRQMSIKAFGLKFHVFKKNKNKRIRHGWKWCAYGTDWKCWNVFFLHLFPLFSITCPLICYFTEFTEFNTDTITANSISSQRQHPHRQRQHLLRCLSLSNNCNLCNFKLYEINWIVIAIFFSLLLYKSSS